MILFRVSARCLMLFFFYYRIIRFLLMVRFVNEMIFCSFFLLFCYGRLYVGYRPNVGRGDATASVGGNCPWLSRREQIGRQSLPGINLCMIKIFRWGQAW